MSNAAGTAIAVTADGGFAIFDAGNSRVLVVGAYGPTAHFGSYGGDNPAPGLFGDGPHDIAVASDGDMLVSDAAAGWISRFDSAGQFEQRWQLPARSDQSARVPITAGADGSVFIAAASTIHRYSADGAPVQSWPVADGFGAPLPVVDLAAGGGRLYAAADGIVAFSFDGFLLDRWAVASGPAGTADLARVTRLSSDPGGVNVFARTAAAIYRLAADGRYLGHFLAPSQAWVAPALGGPPSCDPIPRQPRRAAVAVPSEDVAAIDPNHLLNLQMGGGVIRIDSNPVADIQTNIRFPTGTLLTGMPLRLDASASFAELDTIVRYQWDLDGDGKFELDSGEDPTAETAFAKAGFHEISVVATSATGRGAAGGTSVIAEESRAVVTTAGQSVTDEQVSFDASASDSSYCKTATGYEWDFDGDGKFERETGTDPKVTAAFEDAGPHTVTVRVVRSGGRTDEASVVQHVYPAPPAGHVGVSINDGAQFTNDPDVTINAVWPKFSQSMILSSDGGFATFRSAALEPAVKWRLPRRSNERIPKTVYVRFDTGQIHSDDIILDTTHPVVSDVSVTGGRKDYRLRLEARDRGSGVHKLQLAQTRKRPGRWRAFASKVSFSSSRQKAYVRVRDRAGNVSGWRGLRLRRR